MKNKSGGPHQTAVGTGEPHGVAEMSQFNLPNSNEGKLLQRLVPDIERALDVIAADEPGLIEYDTDDEALPGGLWNPEAYAAPGGTNWAEGGDGDGEGASETWL